MAPGAARGRSPVERALQGSRGRPPAGSGGGGFRFPAVNIPGAARAARVLAPLGRAAAPAAVLGGIAYTAPRVFNPKDNIVTSVQNLGTAIENLGRPPGQRAAYVGSDPAAVRANRRNQAGAGGDLYGRYSLGEQQESGYLRRSDDKNTVDTSTSTWTEHVTPRSRAQAERMNELSQQAGGANYSYSKGFPAAYAAAESVKPVVEQYRKDAASNPMADLPELIDQRSQAYAQRADIAQWLEAMQKGSPSQKKIAADFLAKQRPAPVPLSEQALFRPSEENRAIAEAGYANIKPDLEALEGMGALQGPERFEQSDDWWNSSYQAGDGTLPTPALPGSREEMMGFSEPFLPADAIRESNLSGNEALNRVAPQQAAKTAADRDAAEAGYADVSASLLNEYLQRAQKLSAARFN